jgi:hypothetical protein
MKWQCIDDTNQVSICPFGRSGRSWQQMNREWLRSHRDFSRHVPGAHALVKSWPGLIAIALFAVAVVCGWQFAMQTDLRSMQHWAWHARCVHALG